MNDRNDSIPAAASAAGRELLTGALQRNPLVALAAAILNPVLRFFLCRRGRPTPAQIEKLKLESYRSQPMPDPAGQGLQDRTKTEGLPMDNRRIGRPDRRRLTAVKAGKGGAHHG